MTKKVVIRGPWHGRDRKYIENSEDLQIIHFPQLHSTEDYLSFAETAKQADLVILALFGANLNSHFAIPELLPFLHDTNIRKVYWTHDAQHEWGMGLEYQKFFKRYYLNHSNSMNKYDEVEPYWLPSCFFSIGIDELIELISFPKEIERDVIFPYAHYSFDDRSLIVKRIEEKLSVYGLNYYLGKIEFGLPYLRAIQESGICLNISTLGSLNIRNFEVLALNRILLAEKVADHGRINMDMSHTYFFKRDLSDFDEALGKALEDIPTEIRTSNNIINGHMLVHRYVEIINNELNAHYKVQRIDCQMVEDINQMVKNIRKLLGAEKFEEAHKVIEEAVGAYPNSPDMLNLKGELMIQSGNVEEATKIFIDIKRKLPYHVETLNNIAIIFSFNKDWDGARKLLLQALTYSPSNRSVLENLKFIQNEILLKARNYIQKGYLIEAKRLLNQISSNEEQLIEAFNQLALINIKNGNFEEAEEKLSLVFQKEPNNEEALQNLHYLLEQKINARKIKRNNR